MFVVEQACLSGGIRRNLNHLVGKVAGSTGVSEIDESILANARISGAGREAWRRLRR